MATLCWDEKCSYGIPICCYECDRQEYCDEFCGDDRCYDGGET